MNYFLFILFHFAARTSTTLVVAVDDMSCELLYHLLLRVKALSAQRQLPSRHRALRHLVIHRLLTFTVEA